MTNDNTNPAPDPRNAEGGRSEDGIRDLLDGFVLALKRGEPREEGFHEVMEALFAVGERLRASVPVDPGLMATLGALRRLSVEDVLAAHLPKGRRVGKRQKAPIGTIPLDRVEQWLDTIRSTLASLLDGDAPHRSLTAYSQYLGDHGPGPNSAFFVRLAIRALEDEQVVGATSQANALARLGATEALPALRQAAQRDYRDPGDMPAMARAFDLAIKTALNDAIARLEGRSAPQEAPPLRPAGPAVPLPPSRGGMTTDDLRRIEQAIGRPLPRAVREFFLHYPSELRTTTRDLGPTPDGQPYRECPGDNELTDNADHIIGANARRSGYDADWPDNMLVVGGGGCGETYWVDLDDESGAVYRFDAGTEPEYSDPVAGSLAEFARGLIDSYRNG